MPPLPSPRLDFRPRSPPAGLLLQARVVAIDTDSVDRGGSSILLITLIGARDIALGQLWTRCVAGGKKEFWEAA
jgi:hypothetical protein